MKSLTRLLVLFLLGALAPSAARADVLADRFNAGGYFRIMTRPDFQQGGDSKLGYWNLYGRLLNEGPWGALELKLDMLQNAPGRKDTWAAVFAKIEGGSFANTDPQQGGLGNFRTTQLYVKAGNILFENVTWQLGTLYTYPSELGLYDFRPADLFWDTVGLSATYDVPEGQVLLGFGDAGYGVRGSDYSSILTAGGLFKLRFGGRFEVGVGGQYRFEPQVTGKKNAPYATPGVSYEDYLRGEVVKRWLEEHPNEENLFPNPLPTSSASYKLVALLGFGGFGPLRWNTLAGNFQRLHPNNYYTEKYGGRDYTIFTHDLTDERYLATAGNEMQLTLIEDLLDATWSALIGYHWDEDNSLAAPRDEERIYYSTVLRLQMYLTTTVHLLGEGALAREKSLNGNAYRLHADSIFANTGGMPDARGLEYGDTDTRDTMQLKGGVVLNPGGRGIFTRPSLRLLYGLQYSNVQAAFGNGFVNNLDQYNVFQSPERHWHSVFAIEAEAWF